MKCLYKTMNNSKNDIAWYKLFEKYDIINQVNEHRVFEIQSKQINEFREARLMTKFDHASQLPKPFKENGLSILPISRGSYTISKFQTFEKFNQNKVEIVVFDFPSYLESIDYNHITSESIALNCAYICGMIADFIGDERIQPTVSGRMSSSKIEFKIDADDSQLNIKVVNSQIEIDAGYESNKSLILIEAKNTISEDFLVRQLYYPYKLWLAKISKRVRPVFLVYSNGIFHFREYEFKDPNHYNSIELVKEKKYTIRKELITMVLIQSLRQKAPVVIEPSIPFPQANSFERIINLCELLYEKACLSHEEITTNYDFDSRQTDYYTNAGRYLGLINKENKEKEIIYTLTEQGKTIFDKPLSERQKKFIELILLHAAFNKTLALYLQKLYPPTKEEIVAIMKTANLYKISSNKTFHRRASTVSSWIDWILDQVEE